ncbi:SNF1-related protein kinase regulatory subunit gamma-like PV42a [Aristolochia californica]|uniref:SNF1-related protein kinase regulatory subunit gamma-like PV42a n=1 Tax=Aristolochia californica TaxID=171875 RepID=UPI0035D5742A
MQISPAASSYAHLLKTKTVRDLISDKKKLVEVPYTASLAHTMNALVANNAVAVPVAAPPGQWIGAGGSVILESDKTTGAIRKHYIGMVSMLDILLHIADSGTEDNGAPTSDLETRMGVPVSSIIGHCIEGLSLWTLNPNTSILDCMEVFSKGIHRALIPLESLVGNVAGVELTESSPGYRMLTQMDVIAFLKAHEIELAELLSHSVGDLGAITETVFAVDNHTKVIDAIKCMKNAALNAVPIVEASRAYGEEHKELINGRGRKLIGTFSATDLRGCPITQLQSWLTLNVVEFKERVAMGPRVESGTDAGGLAGSSAKILVTCSYDSSLAKVITKAVEGHVHRVWVVDSQGLLTGLIALTDILRVMRIMLIGPES